MDWVSLHVQSWLEIYNFIFSKQLIWYDVFFCNRTISGNLVGMTQLVKEKVEKHSETFFQSEIIILVLLSIVISITMHFDCIWFNWMKEYLSHVELLHRLFKLPTEQFQSKSFNQQQLKGFLLFGVKLKFKLTFFCFKVIAAKALCFTFLRKISALLRINNDRVIIGSRNFPERLERDWDNLRKFLTVYDFLRRRTLYSE